MYLLIDKDRMAVCYRHTMSTALAFLAHIEFHSCAVAVIEENEKLDSFTDLELRHLYKNATGKDFYGFSRAPLIKAVQEVFKQLPICKYNAFELALQAGSISMDDAEGCYQFVPGARRPAQLQDLYVAPALQVTGEVVPIPAEEATLLPALGAQKPRAPITTPSTMISAPRPGGTRSVIWSVADSMWEQAGKPMDQKTVLGLRKQMMDVLEKEHGVKRTSSSNELGSWMKTRLAG